LTEVITYNGTRLTDENTEPTCRKLSWLTSGSCAAEDWPAAAAAADDDDVPAASALPASFSFSSFSCSYNEHRCRPSADTPTFENQKEESLTTEAPRADNRGPTIEARRADKLKSSYGVWGTL